MARLAFFGTPEFSLPSLMATYRFCNAHGHKLAMVVCQADRQQGRGQRLLPPAVKKLAYELNLPVYQPSTLKKNSVDGDRFFLDFSAQSIDLAVVVAYGKIITQRLLALPKRGFVNVHASLLPRFRGAAPIQRAIEAGDRMSGVCLMDMVKELDAGDIYVCKTTPIIPFDTSFTLFHRLANLGGHVLYDHLDDLLHARLKKTPQDESEIIYANMLNKEEGLLDFARSGQLLSNRVMAFDPWPGVYGFINGRRIKFFDSFFIKTIWLKEKFRPGQVVVNHPFLGVKTIDGVLYFQRIQLEGKKAIDVKDAVHGFHINIGDTITHEP
jgi:methionyl-tRNA formyltransferase